jgi:hypothetical protein
MPLSARLWSRDMNSSVDAASSAVATSSADGGLGGGDAAATIFRGTAAKSAFRQTDGF